MASFIKYISYKMNISIKFVHVHFYEGKFYFKQFERKLKALS